MDSQRAQGINAAVNARSRQTMHLPSFASSRGLFQRDGDASDATTSSSERSLPEEEEEEPTTPLAPSEPSSAPTSPRDEDLARAEINARDAADAEAFESKTLAAALAKKLAADARLAAGDGRKTVAAGDDWQWSATQTTASATTSPRVRRPSGSDIVETTPRGLLSTR